MAWHETSIENLLLTAKSHDQVHRILVDIVSAAANGTGGLGRYPPLKREVCIITSASFSVYVIKISLVVGEYCLLVCFV
jgi:hypothetical protein